MRSALERREDIRDYLLCHRRTSVRKLAEEFDVSTRTIKYDLEVLACSLPVITVQGRGGGVFLDPEYNPNRIYFNPEEELLIREMIPYLQGEKLKTAEMMLKRFTKTHF